MSTYNGYAPDEERTVTLRRHLRDAGHSAVELTTRRVGADFRFRYALRCECGAQMSGWDRAALGYRHAAHVRAELGISRLDRLDGVRP